MLQAVEQAFGLRTDGTFSAYPSYVNRVYGLRDEEGEEYVVKFYRPGRWSVDAIAEEHEFVLECAAADLPVVAPLADSDGCTLQSVVVEGDVAALHEYCFALYPRKGGRGFDAEGDEEWHRLGALAGRLHAVARGVEAAHRLRCSPADSAARSVRDLRESGVVHPEIEAEFFDLVDGAFGWIAPLFDGVTMHRIHGDFHRGNVLDRAGEGLLLIDFDDMMVGPSVQDLWLLLPDHASRALHELGMIVKGYTQFSPFRVADLRLIEPLRLMRMVYYLAWSALQRDDRRFQEQQPEWGSRAFWIKEVEDVRMQLEVIAEESKNIPMWEEYL